VCLSDVRIYNPETQEMKTFRSGPDGVPPRRAHASTIYGKYLIVHGGINTRGNYLNDLYYFDLSVYFALSSSYLK
jgi:hypothetical protein